MTGLIGNLKTASPPMHRLYLTMKERLPGEIPVEEIAVALGRTVLNQEVAAAFVSKVASTNEGIQHAFERQVEAAAVSQ
jgi:hypothetical protein